MNAVIPSDAGASKIAKAHIYIKTMQIEALTRDQLTKMLASIASGAADAYTTADKVANKVMPPYLESIVKFYVDHYSEEELDRLIEFKSSGVGKNEISNMWEFKPYCEASMTKLLEQALNEMQEEE